jgi:hypothetical protein
MMSTSTPYLAPARPDLLSLNPDEFKHLSAAPESRSEKSLFNLSKEIVENLKSKVKGQIVLPSDSSYDEVRPMIERRPALIVRCAEANDIAQAISFARESGFEVIIREAGHHVAGNALSDNAVMIDLTTVKEVPVDAEKKRADVQPTRNALKAHSSAHS